MLYVLFTLLLVAALPSCTLLAVIICRTPEQQCPDGQYCDLGMSKCMDCETVCDRNNKLRNVAQCRRKCPEYAYLLSDPTDQPVRLPNITKHTSKGLTTAQVTIPTPPRGINPGKTEGQTQEDTVDDNSPGNSDLQTPLLFLLVLLVVVVGVLSLGLVIALIVYLTKQIMESKARVAKGYTKDLEKNGSLLQPTE